MQTKTEKSTIEMESKKEERVLCFESALLDQIGNFEGFSADVGKYFTALTNPSNVFCLPRSKAENDFNRKQLIPYCIIRINGLILRYQRTKSGGESRLHELFSIGIGGHISSEDASEDNVGYAESLEREILEELGLLSDEYSEKAVALINYNDTSVGMVHFGIVHLVDLKSENPAMLFDSGIGNPEFLKIEQIMSEYERLEPWSKICMNNIKEITK